MSRSLLRIVNSTPFRTDDLRRFVLAGLRAVGASDDRHVVFSVRRRGTGGAWGEYGNERHGEGRFIRISLDRDDPYRAAYGNRTSAVLAHEIAHTLGLRHGQMHRDLLYATDALPTPWADGLVIRRRAEAKKPTLADRVEDRETKAREGLARWTRRLALAKTKVSAWKRKVAYYERRKAAAAPAPTFVSMEPKS